MSAPLNLARQPFRNERLPTILLTVGCLALGAATVRHAFVARDLLPGQSRDVMSLVTALEAELAGLRREAAVVGRIDAPAEAIQEWAAVKALVDRRAFSWTGLFAALEDALPPGVRLVSVSPGDNRQGMELSLTAVGREVGDALALLRALQEHPDFDGAFLNGWGQGREGVDISCSVRYLPKASAGRPR